MKVGFIGLGNVGSKLAGTLIRNNVTTFINDLDKSVAKKLIKIGGKWVDNPEWFLQGSRVVIAGPKTVKTKKKYGLSWCNRLGWNHSFGTKEFFCPH